jgi:hypothetical protein
MCFFFVYLLSGDDQFDPIEAWDDFEGVDPREDGVEPATFDVQTYNRKRMNAPHFDVVPQKFRQVQLSKPFDQLSPEVSYCAPC